jgi:hypothetical protein
MVNLNMAANQNYSALKRALAAARYAQTRLQLC